MRKLVFILMIFVIWACGNQQEALQEDTMKIQKSIQNNQSHLPKAVLHRDIFPAQVAGQFYTSDSLLLRRQVISYIQQATVPSTLKEQDIVGILSPHAGYVYSGTVAGHAFASVANRPYSTIVVMALSHRQTASKVSVLDMDAYETPLGQLEIDRKTIKTLLEKAPAHFAAEPQMFEGEHSLEVQLPFIQVALPNVKIIPLIVAASGEEVFVHASAHLFELLGNKKDVLFVISSDLSHFFPYDEAKGYDEKSLMLLEKWQLQQWFSHASNTRKGMCGVRPLYTFAKVFEHFTKNSRTVTRLKYLNSGDASGDKSQVVGYGALAFSVNKGVRNQMTIEKDFGPYNVELLAELMSHAKGAVKAAVLGNRLEMSLPESLVLKNNGAAFVTLKRNGRLRGCIGHVLARMPLYQCIHEVARAAAISDTRFAPVSPSELDELSYEISILTNPTPISPEDVVVGRDGLIISRQGYSGLLLPQVPIEWGWDKEQFLGHTCQKAGLPLDCWKHEGTVIKAFQAIVFDEDDL